MSDRNDDDRPSRPPGGGSDRPRPGGDRPFRSRDGAPPRQPRAAGDKPLRAREGEKPRPPRSDDAKPFRKPREAGDRPYRAREDRPRTGGERPFRKRPDGERPRPAPGGEDRLHRPRAAAPVDTAPPDTTPEPTEERIAKVIARAGVASRRDVEAMIAEGRVTLNGQVLDSPAMNVSPSDVITVDGEPLPTKERTRLWMFHKPRGLVTTARDPEGRPTVFEQLPEDLPRVVAVGRLDINTEGLLLLTNDGGLARVIAHPDTGWLRRYKVRAHGEVTQADLDRLRDGVTIDGMEYGPVEARLDRVQGDNAWITLGLREGKNREVKRILELLGLQVNRLIRLSFGPFQLGDLEPGLVDEVRTKVLKDQLGAALAQEAGVDFESPVREPIAPFGSPKKRDQAEREPHGERPARGERQDRQDRQGLQDRKDRKDRQDRQDRPPRPDRERPHRFGRDDERPQRRDEGERPFRSRDDRPVRGPREEPPPRPDRNAPKRSVWRSGEDEDSPRKSKAPRRGSDPHEARMANADRPRQRVGRIDAGEGRKVVVERLVSAPAVEERPARGPRREDSRPARPMRDRPARGGEDRPRRAEETGRDMSDRAPWTGARPSSARPRRDDDRPPRREAGDRPFRPRPEGNDRPRRPRPEGERSSGERSFRPRPEGDDRPRRPRPEGDRPFRSRDGDGPARSRSGDDRPRRGPPRGDAPGREGPRGGKAGFKGGGPRGGSKGRPPGGSKGPPRGRRP